jgi:hypothetical protein
MVIGIVEDIVDSPDDFSRMVGVWKISSMDNWK